MDREVNNYFYNSITTRTQNSMLIEKLILSAKVSKLYYKHEIILYSISNKWLKKCRF